MIAASAVCGTIENLLLLQDFFSLPSIGCSVAGSYVNKFTVMMVSPVVVIAIMRVAAFCGKMHPLRVRRNTIYLLFLAYPARRC